MDKKFDTTQLVTLALLIAMEIILTRMLSIQTATIRLSLGFIPIAVIGMMYGPIWGGISAAIADLIGVFLFPVAGPPFLGFTLTAFLTGVVFGLFFYKKEVTVFKAAMASAIVVIFLNLALDTYWLTILIDKGFMILLPGRLLKGAITFALQTSLLPAVYYLVVKRLPNYTGPKEV